MWKILAVFNVITIKEQGDYVSFTQVMIFNKTDLCVVPNAYR